MSIISSVLRFLFTIIDILYLLVLARYLAVGKSNLLSQLLIGDIDQTTSLYQNHKQKLDAIIQRIYFSNFVFITLFTICLWMSTPQFQMIVGTLSLVAFIILMIFEANYRKVLNQLGDELK